MPDFKERKAMNTVTTHRSPHTAARPALLIAGILLIAANLRAPFTGLPPLLGPIASDFGLGTTATGALTTLPLLAFALLSPFSAAFARACGLERALFGALATIALGVALRSAGVVWCLYAGTWLIGMGIAVGNVLLPSLVKRDFAHNFAAVTGAYALSMGIAAALGSAVIVPLADAGGWRVALASFLVLPLTALAVWTMQLAAHTPPAASTATLPHANGKVWHSALAWQVTLFLGISSVVYYVVIGWLPAILVDAGLSPAQAGSLHGAAQLATAVPGLFLGPVLRRLRDQRLVAVAVPLCVALSLLGLLVLPQYAVIWSLLWGLTGGTWFLLALTLIGLRTGHAQQTAALSGMAQSVGYLLAAVGPMAVGALHETLGGWQLPLGLCVGLACVAAVMGTLAGRDRHVGHPS
jgi:CP family cyanate transporter-like MFS transporter